MSPPIIRVENLGKSYRINHQSGANGSGSRYRRLSEEILHYPKQLLSRLSQLASRYSGSAGPRLSTQGSDRLYSVVSTQSAGSYSLLPGDNGP